MEDSLYDEFGNYIGPEIRSSDESESESEASQRSPSDDERSEAGDDGEDRDGADLGASMEL